MASGGFPGVVLLEDALDAADFLEFAKRTIPRTKWAIESVAAAERHALEGMF